MSSEHQTSAGEYRPVYTRNQLIAATLLGAGFAGLVLFRRNYLNLGLKKAAHRATWYGISLLTLFLCAFTVVDIQTSSVRLAFFVGQLMFVLGCYEQYQARLVSEHQEKGRAIYPWWRAPLIGLAWFLGVYGLAALGNF